MNIKIAKIILSVTIVIICLMIMIMFMNGYKDWVKEDDKIIEATVPIEVIELTKIEEPVVEEPKEIEESVEPELISLGEFKLTAYCSCQKCCGKWALNRPLDESGNEIVYGASGQRLFAGSSVAVDPSVIPLGTEIIINDNIYIAQDTGSAVKGNVIDVYFDSHEDAWNFGLQYAEVFIKAE